jgi:hypothetical protein
MIMLASYKYFHELGLTGHYCLDHWVFYQRGKSLLVNRLPKKQSKLQMIQ